MVEWKEITGFPGYEVSNNGQVRRGTSIKAQFADRKGYLSVRLWMHGKSHTRFVARLVAAAFIGERPEGMVVCHINGIKDDNHVENLKYGTPTENEHDKRRHGTAPIGERHPAAKLTEDKVLTIRARYRKNSRTHGTSAIAKEYGVSGGLICAIVNGRLWQHV